MSEPGGAFHWEMPVRIRVQEAGKPDCQGIYTNAVTLLDAEFSHEMDWYFGTAMDDDGETGLAERRQPDSVDFTVHGAHLRGTDKSYHVELNGRFTKKQARQLRDALSLALLWLERDRE